MTSEMTTCPPADPLEASVRVDTPTVHGLRLEIQELKQRSLLAVEIFARHATMLREGDHRIKNSLQLAASLMRLQAMREQSVSARNALRAAAERVRSIADIHDALQGAGGHDAINLGQVLRKMCSGLQHMAGAESHVTIEIDVDNVETSVALAQPILLAVNELVINALRHAFVDRATGIIRVSMRQIEGTLHLRVQDNGVGLPDGGLWQEGLGSTLTAMMVKQIGGELRTASSLGATFVITAPLPFAAITR